MTFRVDVDRDPVIVGDLADLTSGADESRAAEHRLLRSANVRAQPNAPAEQADVVDLASLESFPASDPPGWIGVSLGAPGGNTRCRAVGEEAVDAPGLHSPEPDRPGADVSGPDLRASIPARQVGERRSFHPGEAQGVAVRIYRPGRSATQSGRRFTRCWVLEFEPRWAPEIEPLMGWTSSRDTRQQVRLSFPSKQSAVAFAGRQGWLYTVVDAPEPKLRPPFRSERLGLWPRPPLRRPLGRGVLKEAVRRTREGEELREGGVRS